MPATLSLTLHDPEGRLLPQAERQLPRLQQIFAGTAVVASPAAHPNLLALLAGAGAAIERDTAEQARPIQQRLGSARRQGLALALTLPAPTILACDADRILHWSEAHPHELADVAARLDQVDFTVLGRTPRAFASHPRVQRDTEAIVNQLFARVTGLPWDVTTAARGLSRRAAAAIVAGCPDDSLGVDTTWPLFLRQQDGFSLAYVETEGLEFETADRHAPEIAAAGGLAAWLAQLDNNPRLWQQRLAFAQTEIAAMLPYL